MIDTLANKPSVSDLKYLKIENIRNRVLKKVESMNNGVNELKSDVSNLTQTISSTPFQSST